VVLRGLLDIGASLPFPLLGLDSDNGSEFINERLYRSCTERGITVTRSRPYRKNHNCFVEPEELAGGPQKRWLPPLRHTGRARSPERAVRLAPALP
jgi:hypothetical protein